MAAVMEAMQNGSRKICSQVKEGKSNSRLSVVLQTRSQSSITLSTSTQSLQQRRANTRQSFTVDTEQEATRAAGWEEVALSRACCLAWGNQRVRGRKPRLKAQLSSQR